VIRIALLSPKGPLYLHRGGIFKKSLRYAPLTLPTLAALIPREIDHELRIVDEGIEEIPPDLDADLIGMTVITGTAVRAYKLAGRFRARGIPVVLGGPHVTLVPEDAAPHADAIVVGYAEESWPELLRDFARRRMRARYDQRPDLSLADLPPVRRDLIPPDRYLTTHVFEATRACIHACDFCVVPFAWGRKPLHRPVQEVIEEIRRTGARKAIFVDLNIIADKEYAARLFEALIPLGVEWYGLSTTLLADDLPLFDLCARSGCRGLLMGLETMTQENLREFHKGFNSPRRAGSRSRELSSSASITTPRRSSSRRPASPWRPASICRALPFSRRFRARPCTGDSRPRVGFSRGIGSCTMRSTSCSNRRVCRSRSSNGAPGGPGSTPIPTVRSPGACGCRRPRFRFS
jgi:hypothetical protein